ncbi:hypothetical protein DVG79_01120 [Exiguobacterium sp. RIT594]|nr:hypothetical protein DVG79_01120 [Exiguobacterium sp. RIT594]
MFFLFYALVVTRFTRLLQEKAQSLLALSETNKTRLSASMRQANWLVSRLRKAREKKRAPFAPNLRKANERLVLSSYTQRKKQPSAKRKTVDTIRR